MNLYEIDSKIMETFDEETGEILNESLLNELQMAREEKLTNIIHYIKNLESDAEALKKAEQDFKARKESATRKAESLRKYLEKYLQGETYESEDKTAKVTYRKTESVEVLDVWRIPEEFRKYKAPEADKTALKKWIKEGNTTEGAWIVEGRSMQIK